MNHSNVSSVGINNFILGIKSFKRQVSKNEKIGNGFSFGDDEGVGDLEDLDKLRDDLEATKQLLELEVRSKSLLEKDNKRLQAEIERLRYEVSSTDCSATVISEIFPK